MSLEVLHLPQVDPAITVPEPAELAALASLEDALVDGPSIALIESELSPAVEQVLSEFPSVLNRPCGLSLATPQPEGAL